MPGDAGNDQAVVSREDGGIDARKPVDAHRPIDAHEPVDGQAADAGETDGGRSNEREAGVGVDGITKVATGEYEVFFLANGQVYAYGGGPYEGIQSGGIPAVPIDVPAGTSFVDAQGGLHQSLAVDSTHHVWTWGDNTHGQLGNGQDNGPGSDVLPYRVTRDSKGNDFGNVIAVTAGANAGNEAEFDGALKSDGTVWVWGDCSLGLAGDGTMGQDLVYPTQVMIPVPSGVTITRFLVGYIGLALASDGGVWVWGGAPRERDQAPRRRT